MDDDVVKEAERVLRKQGLDIRTGTRVTGGGRTDAGVFIEVEKDGKSERIEGDYVLVSVGRRPVTTGIDAAGLGLKLGKRGEILVDDQMRTNLPNVYAIGDCVPGPMLAHKAEDEGVIAAEVIAGKPVHMHYKSIPGVVYTWPEIAVVGLTERQVKESGREYRTGRFPFSANGRARSMGENAGFVKFVADAKTRPVLLFPHEDAVPLSRFSASETPITLVVPDGTWRQASKVRARVPGLRDIPCVCLPKDTPSMYRLRATVMRFSVPSSCDWRSRNSASDLRFG